MGSVIQKTIMNATIASVCWAIGSICEGTNQTAKPTSGPNTEPTLMRNEISSAASWWGGAAASILTFVISAVFDIRTSNPLPLGEGRVRISVFDHSCDP